MSKNAPTVRSASAFDTPAASATASISSALVMDFPLLTDVEGMWRSAPPSPSGCLPSNASNYNVATIDVVALAISPRPSPCGATARAVSVDTNRGEPRGGAAKQLRPPHRRGVLLSRPEEPAQAVTASAGHDVHVEMRHALADDVVVGDEGALGPERDGHHGRHRLHPPEERPDVADGRGRRVSRGAVEEPPACDRRRAATSRGTRPPRRRRTPRGHRPRPATIRTEHALGRTHRHTISTR